MKQYEVWVEGFKATGQCAGAQKVGEVMADSFDEAVEKLYRQRYTDPARYDQYVRRSNGIWSEWGCRIYDNEQDARKSFG